MIQTIYTAGLAPYLKGNCDDYFEAYCIDEVTATNSVVWMSNRFTFKDGFLVSHESWTQDNTQFEPNELSEGQKNVPYKEVAPKKIYSAFPDEEGIHQLGGEPPADFTMPKHNLPINFQYIGFISRHDELFNFLPFETLHLVYPMLADCFGMLVMDYSDPLSPKFVEMDGESDIDACPEKVLDCIDETTIIRYEACRFSLKEKIPGDDFAIGSAGIFDEAQSPSVILSPLTKKPMQLVTGFKPLLYEVKIVNHNIELDKDDWQNAYLNHLDFGYQMLAVWIEPETRLVAYCPTN